MRSSAHEFNAYLFDDDFEDGNIGDWSAVKGNWIASNGELSGTSNRKAEIISSSPACTRCTIQATLRIDTAEGRASLLGLFADKQNHIELLAMSDKGKWVVKQRFNRNVVSKGKAIAELVPGTSYRVKVIHDPGDVISDPTITVFLDGVQIIRIPSVAQSNGVAGFRVKSTNGLPTTASFGDIEVY